MKVREAIALIESDGWYLVHFKGSHRQYKHPVKPGRVTVAGKPSADLPQQYSKAGSAEGSQE